MKTQTIHTNEMTPRPFFGGPANQTTHNLTSAARLSAVAATHDHKEVNMKTQTLASQPRMNGFTAILVGAILVGLSLIAGAGTAFADTVYSNFTPSTGNGYDGATFYTLSNNGLVGGFFTATTVAVTFTVPAGMDYKLSKIEVMGAQSTGYGSFLHAYIVTNPIYIGTDYSSTSQLAASPSLVTFDTTLYPMILKASHTYYLKVEVDTGSGLSVAKWYKNSANIHGSVWYNDPSNGDATYHNLGANSQYPVFRISGTPQTPPAHCSQKVTYYDGTLLTPWWDGANCYIKPVATGATPFIWNNGYYVIPDKSQTCLAGTGWFDGANCVYMSPKPLSGFIVNDKMYVPPVSGSCPPGTTLDGTNNCLVKAAPWGTHAFEWANNWYFTTLFTCKDGGYDGANCYIMKAPPGTTPFIWSNNFYYAE
jgi:hypothetical protein